MSEISSGLVAVAWLAPSNYEWPSHFFSMTEIRNGEPLVRLSDAEAIINDLQTLVIAENQRKQQLEQEVAQMKSDLDEEAHIRDRMAQLLAETAVALKGPEKALHRHGWQDLPDVAAKQSAALKLAREALFDMQDSYAAVHGWKDSFVIAATTAIAAIDSLQKGE